MPNESGRVMVKYAKTKSDPICKWRNATIKTVMELVDYLPKESMSHDAFKAYMEKIFPGDFFRTPYQLAAQLGLYYDDKGVYTPRFDHSITNDEALAYMQKWMSRYYVPNPYTKRGFVGIYPSINLLNGIAYYLDNHPTKPNLATAGAALFGGEMGNILNVKYILNTYSNIISVDRDFDMKLLLNTYGDVDVNISRDDKKAFFEHFN